MVIWWIIWERVRKGRSGFRRSGKDIEWNLNHIFNVLLKKIVFNGFPCDGRNSTAIKNNQLDEKGTELIA